MKILSRFISAIFLQLFKCALSKNKENWIVDIDNTLANTGDYIRANKCSLSEAYAYSYPLTGTIDFIKSKLALKHNVIYLSARPYNSYFVTISWLEKHDLPVNPMKLILVKKAFDKITFLNAIMQNKYSLNFIDDLSYNHENGEVLFYDDIINEVRNFNLNYFGLNFIKSINEKNS